MVCSCFWQCGVSGIWRKGNDADGLKLDAKAGKCLSVANAGRGDWQGSFAIRGGAMIDGMGLSPTLRNALPFRLTDKVRVRQFS